jgi:uncharacterized protein RhaS with RHS repeats
MNGRIYDPLLGRFLSADLVVQAPGNLQSYNRYAYVMNNPLSLVDPSGFIFGTPLTFSEFASATLSGMGSGAVAYANGFNQGVVNAVGGTVNAVAHPVDTSQKIVDGIGTVAGNIVTDPVGSLVSANNSLNNTLSDPNKLGQAMGGGVTNVVGGVGVAKAAGAVAEVASSAVKTETVTGTGTAEARVAQAAPETGVASEIKPTTAPTKEAMGGAHSDVQGVPGNESHHMPADSVSPISTGKGPAISMEKADHVMTASWGSSKEAKAFRAEQKALIAKGDFKGAQNMDIKDVQSKFGDKYNVLIKQMEDYTKKLKKPGEP